MKLFKSKKPNLNAVALKLLNVLSVKVNGKTIDDKLQNHPEYPSILSLNDCLTELNIANETFKISKENYNPIGLIFPFVAHFNENNGTIVMVNRIENGSVSFADENANNIKITEDEFLKRWSGILLFAQPDETSGEKGYKQNRLKYFLQNLALPIAIIFLLGIFSIVVYQQPFSFGYISLSILKLLGLSVSILLLIQSINTNNPFIQNLCNFGGKNNCNAILKSNAAKVTSWLSWSEVGFFYFAGSLLSLLIAPSSLFLLGWLNVLSLPNIVYSIFYQYRSKNWCLLCCTVQVILGLEFLTFLRFNLFAGNFQLSGFNFLFSALCFLSSIIFWAFLKPFFINAAKLQPVQQQLKKFKYNANLFNQALTSQKKYTMDDDLMPIAIGNPNAATIITMVSNPFCGPCGKAHQVVEEWLATRDDIQLKVLFTTSNDANDTRTKVARHVSALTTLADKKIAEKALSDWYVQSNKKYETWAEKYPVTFNGEMTKVTARQKQWCDEAEITFTPTIFINGYKMPEPYTLEDIKYLII